MKKFISIILLAVLLTAVFSTAAFATTGYYVKATASVNLRKGPGLSYEKITSVSKGATFTYNYVSELDDRGIAWHQVIYKNSPAWISWKYSDLYRFEEVISEDLCVYTTGNVNLRKGAGTEFASRAIAPKGSKLVYLGEYSWDAKDVKWYKVSSEKGILWLSSRYAKLINPTSNPAAALGKIEATGSLYVRKTPSLTGEKVGVVHRGDVFEYFNYRNDERGVRWYEISFKGESAWISSKYSKRVW